MEVTISVSSKETCNQKTPEEGGEAAERGSPQHLGLRTQPPRPRFQGAARGGLGSGGGQTWEAMAQTGSAPPHPWESCLPAEAQPEASHSFRGADQRPPQNPTQHQRAGLTLIPEHCGDQIDCPALPLNRNGPIIPPPSPDPISKPQ